MAVSVEDSDDVAQVSSFDLLERERGLKPGDKPQHVVRVRRALNGVRVHMSPLSWTDLPRRS